MAVSIDDAVAVFKEGNGTRYVFQDKGKLTERLKKATLSGSTFVGRAKQGTPVILVPVDKNVSHHHHHQHKF